MNLKKNEILNNKLLYIISNERRKYYFKKIF